MLDDKTSVLSQFLVQHLPDVPAWRAAYRQALPSGAVLRPEWGGEAGPVPYGTLGHAIDVRLRLALTPDAVRETFESGVCRYTTDALVTDGLLGLGRAGELEQVRPLLAHDTILGLPGVSEELSRARRHVGKAACLLLERAAQLARRDEPWAGPSLLAEAAAEEQLCRTAFVVGWLEECFRTGRLFPGSALDAAILAAAAPHAAVAGSASAEAIGAKAEELIKRVPTAAVKDLMGMLALAEHEGMWAQLRSASRITLAPTFAGSKLVGGADADVVADGLLIDVKATVDPRRAKPQDLLQLLGYALLDFDDEYDIDAVGIFLARSGRLISWPLAEVLTLLGGAGATVGELREALRSALEASRAAKRRQA